MFGLLAMIGVGAGAVVNRLAPASTAALPTTYFGSPVDQPATLTPAPAEVPAIAPEPATPLVAAAVQLPNSAETPRAAPAVVKVKTTRPLRRATKARPQPLVATDVAAAELSWEDQRDEYVRARAVYDAAERNAGYEWARQNNIRVRRHCSVAAQRTPAFVEGCMSYRSSGRRGVAATPRDPPEG
jgi:hypothetical protein